MYKRTLLVELGGFCGEMVLPNFHLLPNCVGFPWCSPEHMDFQCSAWFTALHDPVPISGNSNHMSSCDLLLCSATGFINKVERSFPP